MISVIGLVWLGSNADFLQWLRMVRDRLSLKRTTKARELLDLATLLRGGSVSAQQWESELRRMLSEPGPPVPPTQP